MLTFRNMGNMGRFGNQMFQFASTIGIARKLGYDPVFPSEMFIGSEDPNSYNGFKLNECFNIPSNMIRSISDIKVEYLYNESTFTYDSQTESIPDNVDLSGYFQTEKYFSHIDEEIRSIFKFKESIILEANSIMEIMNGISIHVRRGDYINYPLHHPSQDIQYYNIAISEFPDDSNFYVFSDDIEWCRSNISTKNIQYIDSKNPYIDMYLMTQCEGHIIANSSFSWWGAWLAKNSKKIIAPSKWFGPQINKDTRDVYCKNWKII